MSLNGLLIVDKSPGMTSRDVVNHIQRMARPEKVGHAGTLDPLATGVLVVLIGSATRLVDFVHQLPKSYEARFQLGVSSASDDTESPLVALDAAPHPTLADCCRAAEGFKGTHDQRPPAFSAIKVGGRRAHRMARQGVVPILAPRQVTLHSVEVTRLDYPELDLRLCCSTGYYVRALGRDLAEALGTVAVMTGLVRTAVGAWRVEQAIGIDALTPDAWQTHLRPNAEAVAHMPRAVLDESSLARLAQGQRATWPGAEAHPLWAVFAHDGALHSIASGLPPGELSPKVNLRSGNG